MLRKRSIDIFVVQRVKLGILRLVAGVLYVLVGHKVRHTRAICGLSPKIQDFSIKATST